MVMVTTQSLFTSPGVNSASPEMRMRLGSALDQNEQLDNELVGHLARQAVLKSPATSPRRSQTAIEVNLFRISLCFWLGSWCSLLRSGVFV